MWPTHKLFVLNTLILLKSKQDIIFEHGLKATVAGEISHRHYK